MDVSVSVAVAVGVSVWVGVDVGVAVSIAMGGLYALPGVPKSPDKPAQADVAVTH